MSPHDVYSRLHRFTRRVSRHTHPRHACLHTTAELSKLGVLVERLGNRQIHVI